MAVEWMLPIAKEVYDRRQTAYSAWDKLVAMMLGKKTRIAIVGPGAVGKSVLADHLTGTAQKKGYEVPSMSRKAESRRTKSFGNRIAITVSPGQAGPKIDTYNEVFDTTNPVDGVVFTVASGYISSRDKFGTEANIARGIDSISKWRELGLATELKELREVVALIRACNAKSRRPTWLLVAVTKADLFYSEISSVEEYYSPHGTSEFSSILNGLVLDAGKDNFTWDALPVCSVLEDFIYADDVVKSSLNSGERDHYLSQLLKRMGEMCQ